MQPHALKNLLSDAEQDFPEPTEGEAIPQNPFLLCVSWCFYIRLHWEGRIQDTTGFSPGFQGDYGWARHMESIPSERMQTSLLATNKLHL